MTPDILADAVEAIERRVDVLRENTRHHRSDDFSPSLLIAVRWDATAPALARFREAREGKPHYHTCRAGDNPHAGSCVCACGATWHPAAAAWFSQRHPPPTPAPLDPVALEKAVTAYRLDEGGINDGVRAAIETYLRETGRGA